MAGAKKDDRLEQIIQALRLMIETLNTQSQMLVRLMEMAAPPAGPSPLEEAMGAVAKALREQTTAIEKVNATLDGLGAEVEESVVRGVKTAFGKAEEPAAHPAAEAAQPAGSEPAQPPEGAG